MSKKIKYGQEARELLKEGADIVSNAIKVTLGPKGRNVVIGQLIVAPQITKDGATVADAIFLFDKALNIGAQMIKDVAKKTAEDAGDGTTTASVLAQSIISHGLTFLELDKKPLRFSRCWFKNLFNFSNTIKGVNPIDLKKGIDKAVAVVVESIKAQAIQIDGDFDKIKQVAVISANGDEFIGALIADAMERVTLDGQITVKDSNRFETYVDVVNGMTFEQGYLSPHMITDQNKEEVAYDNPAIIICEDEVTSIKELVELIDPIAQSGIPFIIISQNLDGEAFSTLVVNRAKGGLRFAAVKAPSFGDNRREILEDIAILTGGVLVSEAKGLKMIDARENVLGSCESIKITKDSTTIIGGEGNKDAINERVALIKTLIENCADEAEKLSLKNRLAKLVGGIGVLYVGADSEMERKEKKDRIDDALGATRAAVEEGIVPGGGLAYIRSIDSLNHLKGSNADEAIGIEIIKNAIEAPLRQILANAGADVDEIVRKVNNKTSGSYGYNARTGRFENLIDSGVIDPAKVERVALENAASIGGLLITTECVLIEE